MTVEMTTDELEQAIVALQDRALVFHRTQSAGYKTTKAALRRLVAERAKIAKRELHNGEA